MVLIRALYEQVTQRCQEGLQAKAAKQRFLLDVWFLPGMALIAPLMLYFYLISRDCAR